MTELESDTVALMCCRVYDLAGTSGNRCSIQFDGKKLPVKSFEDYCALFHPGEGHAIMWLCCCDCQCVECTSEFCKCTQILQHAASIRICREQ